MASKTLSSPLVSAFNSISSIGESSKMASRLQSDFVGMINFIETQNAQLDAIELPDKKKIKQVSNINVASTFGSPGGLLSSLASGALDIAGFLGNFFPGRGKAGRPLPFRMPGSRFGPKIRSPKITPRGSKLRFGGIKGLGVLNALFTGLDFYQGLQQGESVGKAATGAGASLAGSIIGGVLGTALGPLGSFAGASLGGFVGGWLGDRVYDNIFGRKQSTSKKLEEKRKKQFESQKDQGEEGFSKSINKFDLSVSKFENFVYKTFANVLNAASSAAGSDKKIMDYGLDDSSIPKAPEMPGELTEVTAEGGELPSKIVSSSYGMRWGRPHRGVDYPRPNGTPVSVIQPGTVTYARWNDGGYGNLVEISHPGGTITRYAHLSKILVKEGQQINPGTVIGNTGSTGRSTGPHVHFEVVGSNSKGIQIPNNEGDKYFRFGGNVKVKSGEKPSDSTSGPSSGVFNLELHSVGKGESQRSGLIANLLDPENKLSKDLISKFGRYPKGFRDLGGPKRGLNLLETDMTKGVEYNAKLIFDIIRKHPNLQINLFAGHNDVTTGETGTQGEKEYTRKLAERLSQLSSENKLTNVKYHQSVIANADSDPRNNWNRAKALREASLAKPPGVGGPDMPLTPSQIAAYNSGKLSLTANQIQHYPSYNRPQSSVVMMMPVDSGGSSRSVPTIPSRPSFSNGSTAANRSYSMEGEIVNSFAKIALLTNLSGS